MLKHSFASDNNSGVHPCVMAALDRANQGHCVAYGDDDWSRQAQTAFKTVFGEQAQAFFAFNGTGANVTALTSLLRPWQAVICADCAHINVDECGAPERFTGAKLLAETGNSGKIGPEAIEAHLHCLGFEHHSQPGAVSLTQATELGTLYTPDEISAIVQMAHEHGMPVHMDGARLCNAAAALGCELRELTTDLGVDVLSFGGTKNGLMFGEAVVFLNPEYSEAYKYIRKQGMQLHSKMRFIAAQYTALLTDDLWRKNAAHSNAMAQILAVKVSAVAGVELVSPVETNGVFVRLPHGAIQPLQKRFFFYVWDEASDVVRWMTSFDTQESDIEEFVGVLQEVMAHS